MMNNEIVIVRENMMMGPKSFLNFCLKNHFHKQCKAIQEILSWMSVTHPIQLWSTTLYKFTSWKT